VREAATRVRDGSFARELLADQKNGHRRLERSRLCGSLEQVDLGICPRSHDRVRAPQRLSDTVKLPAHLGRAVEQMPKPRQHLWLPHL
jgi:hypothetical protein